MSEEKMTMNYDEIVISGISGRFPESDNLDELKDNLYNHVDMITADDRRWPQGLYGLPTRSGKIKDLSKFDAQFFSVHGKQADLMDPQSRMLLELTHEAIVDAGINPQTLRGSRTGVYIGACVSEVEEGLAQDVSKISGYALIGCSRSMFANRVSYTFDFHGPSYSIDTACSSSFLALQQAVTGLRTNQCDQAIVGGVNICVRPASSLQFHKLSMLSVDGACKHLDESGNGYVRSETCSAILLQRKGDAKRIYATIVNAKTNTDGNKSEGITFPSSSSQRDLMLETVTEAGINPHDVVYVEAHGTGTPAGDPVETRAIADVFCSNNRPTPLLIGSVKSNLGHAEPASGLNSIAKMLIAFQNESIPGNLHFKTPSSKIPELINGIVKPVVENTPFKGGLVAINSFGFGGVNVHVIMKPFVKDVPQSLQKIDEKIPRVISISGRTEEGINHVFDFIEKNPEKVNKEFIQLLTDGLAVTQDNSGLNTRGYLLADSHPTGEIQFTREVTRLGEKRPVWFVYSGMGSQWPQMAKGLLSIDIFRQSLERSAKTLAPHGVDLMEIVTGDDSEILDTPVASCVAIAAIQIAMTDVLNSVGVVPDGIVGHSVGELGCAYGDGILTPEEMILAAYWRGKCVQDGNLPLGLMAAVGLTWEEAKKLCPQGVVPACYNAHDSVTISGSYNECQMFVKQLQLENVFAREVKSCGIAFHSQYMQKIGPSLLEKLQQVIPERRERSKRWISSSFPQAEWDSDDARQSGPYYFVHNLTSQVLFHDAVQFVPKNAIVVEIAPHCLMQPIVKRTLGSDISYITLAKRGNVEGNLSMFTSALGKLFNLGVPVDYSALYSRVEYPVSHSIQSISSLVKWDHSQSWLVTNYPEYFNPNTASEYSVKIDLSEKDCEFYAGHVIDGRILFPATGYLFLVWEMLAKTKGQTWDKVPVEFKNVTLHRATILPKEGQIKFDIRMIEVNGEFALSEGGNVVVTGQVYQPEQSPLRLQQILDDGSVVRAENSILMTPRDAYKELRLRGYDYHTKFQAISEAYSDSTHGKLSFHNWVILADTMLQIGILGKPTRGLYLPVRFQSVRCDPEVLLAAVEEAKAKLEDSENQLPVLPVVNDSRILATVVPGLEVHGLKVNLAPRRANAQIATLEKYVFTPYTDVNILDSSPAQESIISDYIRVTSALAQKFAQTEPKLKDLFKTQITVDPQLLKEYSEGNDPEHVLVRILRESSIDSLKNLLAKYQSGELGQDLLGKLYEGQSYVRPALELVVENNPTSKLNIVEANRTDRLMSDVLRNYVDASGYSINVNYTLLHADTVQPEIVGEAVAWNNSTIPREQNTVDLLVYKDALGFKIGAKPVDYVDFLESASSVVKPNGFLMAVFRSIITPAEKMLYSVSDEKIMDSAAQIAEFRNEARANCFELVSERTDSLSTTVLLFRLVELNPVVSEQTVIEVTNTGFKDWLEPLKKSLSETAGSGANIWLVGRDTPDNGLVGLVKCLRQEPGGNRVRCILRTDSGAKKAHEAVDFSKPEFAKILKHSLVLNILRDGHLGSFRHMDLGSVDEDVVPTEHAFLNVATRGDLSSLKWYQAAHQFWPELPAKMKPEGEQLCTVYYAPLNFRDIMLASGKLPPDALPGDLALQDCILGLEFAGRDASGKRVMGVLAARGLATSVIVDDPQFLWEVPDKWTMEEASTVPVAYSTAYYALVVRGELEPHETVLIHSGSGGVGQAAIAIALSMNCTVFTTVGSEDKKNYLKSVFPQLTEKNFANSRDLSFEQHILRQTNGRGVDLVLDSLSEEKLQASVRCLAQHGRFLEIGKYDLSQNNPLGMAAFLKNIAFHGILLDALFGAVAPTPMIAAHKKQVANLLTHGIASGAVRPLKSTCFDMNQTEEAFRFMATGKHIGKVVLKIRDEESEKVRIPVMKKVNAVPRTNLSPMKSYIVTGGLGGFGLELSQWLAERGARELVLTSRSGPRDSYQHYVMKKLKEMGVNVVICKADPATMEGTETLIKESSVRYPVGGIFNLAMVLADGFIENQTVEAFEKVAHTKIVGNQNLDEITRRLCPELDYFVAFSSVSCGRGNAGQTNYGFANSSMERVCERRRADGLHGLAIQWGAIGDVGVVSENMGGNDVVIGGTLPQRMPSCLSVFDRFLQSSDAVCCSLVRAKRSQDAGTSGKRADLVKNIARILGIKDAESLAPTSSLSELGMDSLMGVEVKQTLERDYEVILSMQELRLLTVGDLIKIGQGESSSPASTGDSSGAEVDLHIPSIEIPTENFITMSQVEGTNPVFFLPPIEGSFDLLKKLAEVVPRTCYGLNWTQEVAKLTKIEKATKHFMTVLKGLLPEKSDSPIDLVGYSFGSVIAFDMAIKLQAAGKKVNLVFMDASPTYLSSSTTEFGSKTNASDSDDTGIIQAQLTFINQFVPVNYDQLRADLTALPNNEARYERIAELIHEQVPVMEKTLIVEAAKAFIGKVYMMHQYRTQTKFTGDITLLRASETVFKSGEKVPEDYFVSEIVTGKCTLHILNGNHQTFITQNLPALSDLLLKAL